MNIYKKENRTHDKFLLDLQKLKSLIFDAYFDNKQNIDNNPLHTNYLFVAGNNSRNFKKDILQPGENSTLNTLLTRVKHFDFPQMKSDVAKTFAHSIIGENNDNAAQKVNEYINNKIKVEIEKDVLPLALEEFFQLLIENGFNADDKKFKNNHLIYPYLQGRRFVMHLFDILQNNVEKSEETEKLKNCIVGILDKTNLIQSQIFTIKNQINTMTNENQIIEARASIREKEAEIEKIIKEESSRIVDDIRAYCEKQYDEFTCRELDDWIKENIEPSKKLNEHSEGNPKKTKVIYVN